MMINPTQAAILGVLYSDRKPGARVYETVLTVQLYWRLTRSQLYRELEKMTAKGLLIEHELPEEEKSRTGNEFQASDLGRQEYHEWASRFDRASLSAGRALPVEDQQRDPWMLRLMLARHDNSGTDEMRQICRDAAHYYRERAHLSKGVHEFLMGADMHHSYALHRAKWFETTADSLT